MSDYEESVDDKINKIVSDYVEETTGEGVIVTKYVLLAEIVGSESKAIVSLKQSDMTPWDQMGILSAELDALRGGYVAHTIFAAMGDDDED